MGCGASKNDTAASSSNNQSSGGGQASGGAAGGRQPVGRSQRQDVGQRHKSKKYNLGGPFASPDFAKEPREGWESESLLDGVLWKLTKDDEVAYYNDVGDLEVFVEFQFGPDSEIQPVSDDVVTSAGDDNWKKFKMTIFPNECKKFTKGTPNGMKGSFGTQGLSQEFLDKTMEKADAQIESHVAGIAAAGGAGKSDEEVLATCIAKGLPFVDPVFPPQTSSLQRPGIDNEPVPAAPWRRPEDYLSEEEKSKIVLINSAEPDDIDQGSLGDCWFLSAIACLAEFPAKIEDIFKHPRGDSGLLQEKRVGAYRVTLNKGGWWQEVVVDSYFPCSGAGLPKFSKNVQDRYELWVSLLEKAYAKVHGSYSSIVGGDSLFALTDMTGYPTTRFDTEWKDALATREGSNTLFKQMERYDQAGYMLTLGTPGSDTSDYNPNAGKNDSGVAEKYKQAGLAMGHAYSVLQVKSFPDKNVNLCQIRNPWGNATEWSGRWGDNDEAWNKHPDIAKAVNHVKAADGTFWMEWEDVKEYFDGGGCCLSKFDWHDYRIKTQVNGGVSNLILEITAHEDVEVFVIFSQQDKRSSPPGHQYYATLLTIAEPNEEAAGGYKAVRHATSDVDSETAEFCFLAGREVAMLHKFKKNSKPYLVMLREHSGSIDATASLGLISSHQAGAGMSVNFCKTPSADSCNYYKNYPTFEYSNEGSVVADWQYNPEVGTVQSFRGSSLSH